MISAAPALQVRDLTKAFGSNQVLRGVSLDLVPGEALGVIGPNGCGKSTLINCMSGVLRPNGGRVQYTGMDVTGWSVARRARRGLVRTYQNLALFEHLTVLENVLARDGATTEAAMRTIGDLGLTDVRHTSVNALSYGHQRRTELGRALVVPPTVLLLDEPAAGLDTQERLRLTATLRARSAEGMSIALVDHDMSLIAAVCSRVIVLHRGEVIFDGAPHAALEDARVVDVYLGSPLDEG